MKPRLPSPHLFSPHRDQVKGEASFALTISPVVEVTTTGYVTPPLSSLLAEVSPVPRPP